MALNGLGPDMAARWTTLIEAVSNPRQLSLTMSHYGAVIGYSY
jgi:hypothetical protein